MHKRLIIVDISSFIFRAFFAIRPMTSPDGTPVNALYGTLTMVLKLINAYQPSHIVLARDTKGGSFRNEIFPDYKSNRSEPPEELIPQFGLIEELITAMKIPNIAIENYEADDVIGSLVVQFQDEFEEILIASGDKDLMQFVNDKVKMLDTMKDKTYGPADVFEKMGVHPDQIMDYLSLVGDASDHIPGVKGIGAKGAAKLLAEYKNLDGIFKNLENITAKRTKTALEGDGKKLADLSKSLVKIVTDLKLGVSVKDLAFELEGNDVLMAFLDRVNFKSIKSKISNGKALNFVPERRVFIDFEVIKNKTKWEAALINIANFDQVYIEAFYADGNYHLANSKYLVVATPIKTYICYCEEISSFKTMVAELMAIKDILFCSNHVKSILVATSLSSEEVSERFFDLTQAHFILDADSKHDLNTITMENVRESVKSIKELDKESLEHPESVNLFETGLARRGHWAIRAYPWLKKKMDESGVAKVFYNLDLRLEPILAAMESEGILLNARYYQDLETDFQKQADEIEKQIKSFAEDELNIRSTKQLGFLLFEKLQLPVIKKTKTGYSTDSSVLEELNNMGLSEVPGLILKFRELDKLLSTYVKTFPKLIGEDNKIHTHFLQYVAATGRLSSENPNLQNIPIKTENGRKLRKGFVARKGYRLLGADYSQVELRILAHFAEDEVMLDAFKHDKDIHRQTAAEVFGIKEDEVSSTQRGFAKAINFGLMYGQSSFGLSQTLGISRTEAKDYITRYFTRFNRVKSYLDGLKELCEAKGYSETLMGRRRIIKDINSSNRQTKSMAERMAINSPIQGTAADIIKKAMIAIDHELRSRKLESKMLLQVHDELIFEVPEQEVDIMKNLVKAQMESAVELSIPLKVDIGVAENWYDLK